MESHRRVFALVAFHCLIWISESASAPSKDSLGIAPQDENYYKFNVIKCKDGSKKFTKEELNDEFCDCPDGTDEPGTSACPEGKFYCRNTGHVPLSIFSSRVNDGICDCCDGSDEYDGKEKCTNTCWEAGKVAREKLKKKIATYQEGVIIRKQEVDKAKEAFARDEVDLSNLKDEEKMLKGLVQKLKEHKEQIEKVEEQERLKKEQEEERLREAERKASEQAKQSVNPQPDDTKAVHDKWLESLNQHAHAVHLKEEEDKVYSEGLSREELGRLVASCWTGQNSAQQTNLDNYPKEKEHQDNPDNTDSAKEEDYDGFHSDADEDSQKYDNDDIEDDNVDDEDVKDYVEPSSSHNLELEDETEFSDFTASSTPSWLDKFKQTGENILHAINLFKTPVDASEADRIRKEYGYYSSKLSKIQSRISSLTEKLKHDFGMEMEFYSFYDHCFETKQNQYVYKVCCFKQASQVDGYSTTQLGYWEKFDESYRVMLFSNGDICWNGPDRSLKVRLRCGLKNELTDIDEPSRCEYVALLSTPALCVKEKLKELQDKLDLMNSSQPLSHDEL